MYTVTVSSLGDGRFGGGWAGGLGFARRRGGRRGVVPLARRAPSSLAREEGRSGLAASCRPGAGSFAPLREPVCRRQGGEAVGGWIAEGLG